MTSRVAISALACLQIVARFDPASKIKRRQQAKLWADTSKLHLFDPESGESLARGERE